MGGKYESQQKYNRKTYVRFPLDLKPDVLAAFRAACEQNETTPTTEIKKFIADYIDKNKAGEYFPGFSFYHHTTDFSKKRPLFFHSFCSSGIYNTIPRYSEIIYGRIFQVIYTSSFNMVICGQRIHMPSRSVNEKSV